MRLVTGAITTEQQLWDLGFSEIPLEEEPVIYALFLRGVLQYIGQSTQVRKRLKEHAGDKRFDQVLTMECELERLTEIEDRLIELFRPPLNRPKWGVRRRWVSQEELAKINSVRRAFAEHNRKEVRIRASVSLRHGNTHIVLTKKKFKRHNEAGFKVEAVAPAKPAAFETERRDSPAGLKLE